MAERRVARIEGALVAVMMLRNNGNIAMAEGRQQGNLEAGNTARPRTGPQTEPLQTEILNLQRSLGTLARYYHWYTGEGFEKIYDL